VSQETSADEVKGYFSQFGKVEEAVMLMDQQTKRHRGFGFVTFEVSLIFHTVIKLNNYAMEDKLCNSQNISVIFIKTIINKLKNITYHDYQT
jgi:RNA recognition motif-containing protein